MQEKTKMDTMKTVRQQVVINRPIEEVWMVISNIGDIKNQNPGNSNSYITSNNKTGMGASRRVEKKNGKVKLDQKVIDWQEGKGFTLMSTNIEGLPIVNDFATLTLDVVEKGASCRLTISYSYEMKGLAKLMASRKMVAKGLRTSVLSFKYHIEEGVAIDMDTYNNKVRPIYKDLNTDVI